MTGKRGFQFFSGDVNWLDYGGTWIRYVDGRRFHFIEVTNMDDACGRDNDGEPTYVVELSEVDLDGIGDASVASALKSCGWEDMDTDEPDQVAGCLFSYGNKAPLHSETTNNAHAGYRACRKESYSLTSNASAYQARMERPVNALGSSAREYMSGDLNAAVIRGAEVGDQRALIVAKMYVACDGRTIGGSIPAGDLAVMQGLVSK
jgi:hypothetical protein